MELGFKVAVAPEGKPDTLKLTVPLDPPEGVTLTPRSCLFREVHSGTTV